MDKLNLEGKKAAVFGAGDSKSYPRSFCKAVDILQNKLKSCGAEIILPGLKVDGDAASYQDDIVKWAERIAEICG
jgi:flavodoxin I